jgi:hypothetical protein
MIAADIVAVPCLTWKIKIFHGAREKKKKKPPSLLHEQCLCGLFRVSGLSKTELTTKFDRVVTHLRLESKKVVDKQ